MPSTTARAPETHLVHKALNRRVMIAYIDIRMFAMTFLTGLVVWQLFRTLLMGLVALAGFYVFARWCEAHDPKYLEILLASGRYSKRFDPAKYTESRVEVK